MVKFFITFLIAICVCMGTSFSTPVTIPELSKARTLVDCSSYTDWGSCDNQSSWAYMNGEWVVNPGMSIKNAPYVQSTQWRYWGSSVSQGTINLDSISSKSVNLFHKDEATPGTSTSLCEWRFDFDDYKDVEFHINRDVEIYEDVYLYAMTKRGIYEFTSKELSNCKNTDFYIMLNDLMYLSVRVDKLNQASTYSINVYEIINDPLPVSVIIIAVVLGIAVSAFLMIWLALIVAGVCHWLKKRRLRQVQQKQKELILLSEKHITDTLNAMKHGKFNEIDNPYQIDTWAIWLENFEPCSSVHITNEWSHMYHSQCLKEWYDNIKPNQDLTCPSCKAVNRVPNDSKFMDDLQVLDIVHLEDDIEASQVRNNFPPVQEMHPNMSGHQR